MRKANDILQERLLRFMGGKDDDSPEAIKEYTDLQATITESPAKHEISEILSDLQKIES
jgi:hypothetical protein